MTLYKIGKRALDIVGALIGIALFSPIMLLAALYIKLTSPKGPVFADIPNRVGKDGKEFKFLKFRTMIPNAHQWLLDHPDIYKKYTENSYKLDPDPRLLKGGKFMRAYSIDELPQFINVLKGDMSLVGPRAYYPFELKEQQEKFPETADKIKLALKVKPGITGVWQTSGRSTVDFVERVHMDAEYAKRQSLLYDILIILKTPYVVLTRKGAV